MHAANSSQSLSVAALLARESLEGLAVGVQRGPGDCLFRQGERGDGFYLVQSGTLRLQLDADAARQPHLLRFAEAGALLGEAEALDGGPHAASAYAETEVRLLHVSREAFGRLAQNSPQGAAAIVWQLGRAAAGLLREAHAAWAQAASPRRDAQVDAMVARTRLAQTNFASWSERRVDDLLLALALEVAKHARALSEAVVHCTGLGNVDDKVAKTQFASMGVVKGLLGEPGVGSSDLRSLASHLGEHSSHDRPKGVCEVPAPVGLVFALLPVTSPVATAIFKVLIALKARNALILSPPRAAVNACRDLAAVVEEVLQREGAPPGLVQWVFDRNDRHKTEVLMKHAGVGLVFATGNREVVRAAYASGKPALGVGPGNAPVLVAADADIEACARHVVLSKSFDNGIICGAENHLVVVRDRREALIGALARHGAVVLTGPLAQAFVEQAFDAHTGQLRGDLAGRSARHIASTLSLPHEGRVRLIVVESALSVAGNALASEKLAPVVSLFTVGGEDEGFSLCQRLLAHGGEGHTAVIHSASDALVRRFAAEMRASRILVNTPATHGISGITTALAPSFSLGCGTFGGNSTTDSVGYRHLLNIKRLAMHDQDMATVADYMAHVNPAAAMQSQLLGFEGLEVEAEGCIVRDSQGRSYLDFLAGVGVMNVGHRHPRVVAAVKAQLDRMPFSSRLLINGRAAELGKLLAEVTPGALNHSFFCNSGTEAVEAALKLARAATGRVRIVSAIGSFHGKTFGALAASGRSIFKEPFGPMLPGFTHVPFGDSAALQAAVADDVAAVILEPVQGEGGVHPAPEGYLALARALCDRHGALLILDEVQTGLGRCGRMFACEWAGVAPDLLCLAKALSGGVVPIGAVVGTRGAFRVLEGNGYLHSSTFGGNPLACAAAIAAIEVIRDEHLCERAVQTGAALMQGLREVQAQVPGAIAEVRGLGLLIGVEFASEDSGVRVIAGMARRHVIAAYTLNQPKVIRFEPPLVVTLAQCEAAVSALREAVLECCGET